MRDIKFRAWDIAFSFMHKDALDPSDCGDMSFSAMVGDTDRFKMLQYTGLKDKNGVEIYEGDVIRIKNGNKPITATINYTLTYMGWTLGNHKNSLETAKYDNGNYVKKSALHEYVTWGDENSPKLEVIGNIYENKDLLN